MLHITPELEESLATETEKTRDPLSPRLTIEGLIAPTTIGVSGMVADAVRLGSVLLVAVTIAAVTAIGLAAV
jgi:hypothetical protein